MNDMIRNETLIMGAFAYSQKDFEAALHWIEEGKVNMLPWVESAPLSEGGMCFEKLISGPGKVAKIMLSL
ncbi:hypothetical protein N6H14_04815 [Paenibacillus sp. CC-CFT747]|nr:hypothetical protein N6H14_04815 [Paenibacillus sp. CC-CFT747]